MKVFKYNNLDTLNKAIEQFEADGYKVLAVKIFFIGGKESALGDREVYFVIIDRYRSDRFKKSFI